MHIRQVFYLFGAQCLEEVFVTEALFSHHFDVRDAGVDEGKGAELNQVRDPRRP
jgi:hypothetical protein